MKKVGWIVKTEIQQGQTYFLCLFLVAVVLGVSFSLIQKSEKKISELSSEEYWGADLAVIPKGLTLIDFKREILEGHSTALLPKALFETTVGLAKNQFEAIALLTTREAESTVVMYQGSEQVRLDWVKSKSNTKIKLLQDQTVYKTPEWGTQVISGFLVKGPPAAMRSLKDLIDHRTVAQAILIEQQVHQDEAMKAQLHKALGVYSGVMLAMIFLSIFVVCLWLKARLASSLKIFNEIGFSRNQILRYSISLFLLFLVSPVILGYFITGATFSL